MVRNTGQAAKTWHWYYGQTPAKLKARLSQHSSRLIDLESYSSGGSTKYAAIMNVRALLAEALDCTCDSGTLRQIRRKGEFSAYEINVDARRVGDFVSQNGGRIVDLDTYTIGGKRRFTAVINDNVDALQGRVRSLARQNASLRAARFGMFVRQVGGPTSVGLGADRRFEPASVMKTLHHLYLSTRLEANPADSLQARVQFPTCPPVGGTGECASGKAVKDICPTRAGVTATGSTSLDNADRQMMGVSDNRTTFAIEQRYGRATLNAFAQSIGATSTQIRSTLGCWEDD